MRVVQYENHVPLGLELETLETLRDAETPPEILAAYLRHRRRISGFTHHAMFIPVEGSTGAFRLLSHGPLIDEPQAHQEEKHTAAALNLPELRDSCLSALAQLPLPTAIGELTIAPGGLIPPTHRSALMVPIFESELPGQRLVLFRPSAEVPTTEDVMTALSGVNLLARLLTISRLRGRMGQLNERLNRQIDEVVRVQRSILPDRPPQVPGIRFATAYLPSNEAGGDYFDYHVRPDGHIGFVVADVSGHGPGAAVVMAQVRTATLHSAITRQNAPIAPMVNAILIRTMSPGMFVTAMFLLLDPSTGHLRAINCGHPPGRIIRADGRIEPLAKNTCTPLGILEDIEYQQGESFAQLDVGDRIVLFTDGVTEAMSPERTLFGEPALDRVLASGGREPEEIVLRITEALKAHRRGAEPNDDVCVMVIGRDAPEPR